MHDAKRSRRSALKLIGALPLLTGGALALSACGKKTEPDRCDELSALSDAEKMARSALQYQDKSPRADQRCELCSLFQPAPEQSQCGGCQIVKGPIHPKGYCTAFVAKTAG